MQGQSQTVALATDIDEVEPLEPETETTTPQERPIMVLVSPLKPCTYVQRACILWPRPDRRTLARCQNNPIRIARVIARRTTLSEEAIVTLLTAGRD
jgi:hypothetical protein